MLFGCVLAIDGLVRLTDLQAHYTDLGCQPRPHIVESMWHPAYWSLHMAVGTWPWQALLFMVSIAANLALAVGYRTQWSGWISWVLLVSVHTRNPMILDGGDLYLRCLLFWLMFSGWGNQWSVDSGQQPAARSYTPGSLAYLVQLTLIYACAFLHKTGPEWKDGSAVMCALNVDQLTTPLGRWLAGYSELLVPLCFAVLYFEGLVALLFWLPGWPRWLGVLGLTLMHLSLSLLLHLQVFGLITLIASWGLLPGSWWQRLAELAPLRRAGEWVSRRFSRRAELWTPRRWHWALVGLLLLRVVFMNVVNLQDRYLVWQHDLDLLRLDQRWDMFSPRPLVEDGYYVVVAETAEGEQVSAWGASPAVSWSKPADLDAQYANARWRKLMMNLWSTRFREWHQPMLAYLQRRWEARHPGQSLRSLQLFFVLELTRPDGTTAPLEVRPLTYYAGRKGLEDSERHALPALDSGREVLQASLPSQALAVPGK